MNKKVVVGAAAAVVLVVYGGSTWYMGESARKSYEEAIAQAREFLGPQAVLTHDYERGFWTSKAKLVLQWNPPATGQGADAQAAKPVRIVADSTLRHGPIAGARLAGAVVETRFSTEGLNEVGQKILAKVSAPTLTTVHGLGGGRDLHFSMPAGEVSAADQTIRWQALTYAMHVDASRSHLSGTYKWPEMSVSAMAPSAPEEDEVDDEDDGDEIEGQGGRSPARAARPSERVSVAMHGMDGDFDMRLEDGLWLVAPGTGKGRFDKISVTATVGEQPPKNLLDLQDLGYTVAVERTGGSLGWTTKAQTKGAIGPLVFDAVTMEETVSRIDVEGVKRIQQALLAAYSNASQQKADGAEGAETAHWLEALPALVAAQWEEAAPMFVAALPAYAVKLSATLEGQQASLEYGVEIQKAPSKDEVAATGWAPALLKGTAVHAGLRLPKVWLPRMAKAFGEKEVPAEQIDAMLGMAQAQGFVQQDGEHLSSALRFEGGTLKVNGKTIPLPPMGR